MRTAAFSSPSCACDGTHAAEHGAPGITGLTEDERIIAVEGTPADVFLSYANEDRARIGPLVRALERHGLTVWWDRNIPIGKTWEDMIGEQLKTARSVVVVWTEDSVRSSWVRAEARKGHARRVLVPVLLDSVSDEIPMPLEEIQAADLTDWDEKSESQQFDRLIASLSEIPHVVPKEPVPEKPVPEEPVEPQPEPITWRGRLRARWRLVTGISIAAVLVALIWGVIAILDGNGQPILVDDFSSRKYGWDDVGGMPNGGHYESGTYHISVERLADGQDVMASPRDVSSDANLHIGVEARRTGGTAEEGWGYGVFCRSDGANSFYAFTIWKAHATLSKRISATKSVLLDKYPGVGSAVEGENVKKLAAVCTSTTANGKPAVDLQFSVGDQMILQARDPDDCPKTCGPPLESGTVGLRAALPSNGGRIGDLLDVEFDNFEVIEE